MTRIVQLDDITHAAAIDAEIERVRQSSGITRSQKLVPLFDYLVQRSRAGDPPREVEIVQDVLGRTQGPLDDGAGRVYIHRLRRRLDDFYRDGVPDGVRVSLPLGEYRLIAELPSDPPPLVAPDVAAEPAPPVRPRRSGRWLFAGLAGLAALAAIASALLWWAPSNGVAQAQRSALWRPLLTNGKATVMAEGDYYLFGEVTSDGNVKRLIRDFTIGSRADLDSYLVMHPDEAGRYADVNLSYTPSQIGRAQLNITRVMTPVQSLFRTSTLTPQVLLSANVIYVGLTSGLGVLKDSFSAGSRFSFGDSYDEIKDSRTGHTYYGQSEMVGTEAPRRQYGIVSLFRGKEGNRFVILAGTSEMGMIGLTEAMTDPVHLSDLAKAQGDADAFEALYEITSQGTGVLSTRLIAGYRRDQAKIWSPDTALPAMP